MSEAHRPRRTLRRIGTMLAGLLAIVVILYLGLYIVADRALNKTDIDAKQKTVTSKDGTLMAFEQTGAGPVVIVVTGALADRTGTRPLARHLAKHFAVINYDRRGRGQSTDAQPYAVEREVADIAALIDATGGSAFVLGLSSGAVLALEAASELGGKVKKLFMYEPPFIIDGSRSPMPDGFGNQITELVSEGHKGDAVTLFFTKGMGIPSSAVTARGATRAT
jgi:pimeloyl-ACP methyl ester carboxylesterase